MKRTHGFRFGCALAALTLMACGGDDTASAPQDVSAKASEPLAGGATPESGEAGEEIDANSLREAGSIEIKQYSVAYMGSGTLGKGTLIYQGREHPFRIGGLGIGGIGVASIDAHGFVYDLPDLESFTGAYGNARMGFTAADKGKGRLWLKNTNGVVLKLWTEMKGLALTGGVDGIIITWEADVQEAVAEVAEGTEEALDDTKDGSKKAWKSTKDAFR